MNSNCKHLKNISLDILEWIKKQENVKEKVTLVILVILSPI